MDVQSSLIMMAQMTGILIIVVLGCAIVVPVLMMKKLKSKLILRN
jgi:hypothetical protein